MSGNIQLRDRLNGLIRAKGRISFAEYMEEVLYHPEFGYYSSSRNPIGPAGDFYTSANVDPAMGQLLAELFREMAMGIDGFVVVEIGAGSGLLARHILEACEFPYVIVERSPAMRRRQAEALEGFDVTWLDAVPQDTHGCVFSNEFFDALPVRRFVRRGDQLRELFVGEGLSEVEAEPDPHIALPLLQDGAMADIAPEAAVWVREIGNRLARGYHLAIDYGYRREELFAHRRGTLMCYRRHQAVEDPYADPGEKDLTAHVNFSDLIDAGSEVGLDLVGLRSQKDFLVDLGLLDVMSELAEAGNAAAITRLQLLKNLILPPMMGERFRVLLQRKGVSERALPGFEAASRFSESS